MIKFVARACAMACALPFMAAVAAPLTLHFHGNPSHAEVAGEADCSGQGLVDTLACGGPFLSESAELATGAPAMWVEHYISGTPFDPSWSLDLSAPLTVEGYTTAHWWSSCTGCVLGGIWRLEVWADGVKKFDSGEKAMDAGVPGVPQLHSLGVTLPQPITATQNLTVKLVGMYIDASGESIVYYDSAEACPGSLGTEACDSRIVFGATPPPPPPTGVATVRLAGPDDAGYAVYQSPAALDSSLAGAGEPTLDVNYKTGSVFFRFWNGTAKVTFGPTGATWQNVSDPFSATGGDSFLAAGYTVRPIQLDSQGQPIGMSGIPDDSVNSRILSMQLLVASSAMGYSDDDGASWLPAKGGGDPHGADNQSVASGPYPATLGFPKAGTSPFAVYYCSHSAVNAFCSRSDTGGATFNPSRPIFPVADLCNNHGHVKVGPDGTVYVPINNRCAVDGEGLSISVDGGENWNFVRLPGTVDGRWDSSVAIARDGKTVWYAYGETGIDHPMVMKGTLVKTPGPALGCSPTPCIDWNFGPATDLAVLTDNNPTKAPFLNNIVFATVVAGDPDRATVLFHGTDKPGDSGDRAAMGSSDDATGNYANNARWYLYAASTTDGGNSWAVRNVTPNDPVQKASICDNGTTCPTSPNERNLLDFMDAVVDGQGRVLLSFADGCLDSCVGAGAPTLSDRGTIARLESGPRLYAMFDPVAAPPGAPALSASRGPAGVDLLWSAPASNSAIQGYRLERSVDGGAFQPLATVAGNATSYRDATANVAVLVYAYRLLAESADGTGPFSPVVQLETTCSAPGVTLARDVAGDAKTQAVTLVPGAPAPPGTDLLASYVQEPLGSKLIFTLKADPSQALPPLHRWAIYFNKGATQYYVAMQTADNPTTPSFDYGTTAAEPVPGGLTTVRAYTRLGALEPQSSYNPNGTITLVLDPSRIGLTPGTALTNIFAVARSSAPTQGGGRGLTVDDTYASSYTVFGNAACVPVVVNQAPVAALSVNPSSGIAGQTVFTFSGAASTDADGTVVAYEYDFGDASPDPTGGASIGHVYEQPGTYLASLRVKDDDGAYSVNAVTVPVTVTGAPDTTPDAFTFAERTGVATSAYITSETRSITGIDAPAAVSIVNGQYRLNGGSWTSAAGQAADGDTIAVRHVSSPDPGTTTQTDLTVGTYSTSFRSTTTSVDRTPDAFGFATQTGVARSTVIESNVITPAGYNTAISVVAGPGAEYRINGGAWTAASGTLNPGDTLQTRHTSSASALTYTKTYVKAGGVTGYFSTRTN